MPGRSKLDFRVTGQTSSKTVKALVPVDIFLVAGIEDGEGKKSNRLVFRAKGDKKFYFLLPKGSEEKMKPAAQWLQDLLENKMLLRMTEEIPNKEIIDNLPLGDPQRQTCRSNP